MSELLEPRWAFPEICWDFHSFVILSMNLLLLISTWNSTYDCIGSEWTSGMVVIFPFWKKESMESEQRRICSVCSLSLYNLESWLKYFHNRGSFRVIDPRDKLILSWLIVPFAISIPLVHYETEATAPDDLFLCVPVQPSTGDKIQILIQVYFGCLLKIGRNHVLQMWQIWITFYLV